MLLNTVSKKDLTMKLFDLDSPHTKQSKKVLEDYFGDKIDFTRLEPKAASDMLTKVRGLIYEHRATNRFVGSENDPSYMKMIVMERGLHARLSEADITLEPATGAQNIMSNGKKIGTAHDPAAADAMKKAVEKGDITLGESGQTKHEFIRELFKTHFGQPDYNEETGFRTGRRRLKLINMPKVKTDTRAFEKAIGKAGLSGDVRIKAADDGSYITVLYPDAFRKQSIAEADYSPKKARAGKDIGKPGKNFKKISKDAAKRYGSKKAGDRVAGAILAKMREGFTLRRKDGTYLTENEVQQAQVVLAAQDMVDRMQKMLEDVTSMQFKDLPALSGSIQTTIGTDQAQAFNNAAGQSLAVLVDAIQAAKVEMETAQGTLTGVEPVVPGQEEVAGTPAVAEPVADPLAADPIDATADVNVDAAAGGQAVDVNVDVDDAALGRARR